MRPGVGVANADEAQSYGGLKSGVRGDFDIHYEYQASDPITQTVSEPCPALICQLRKSAAEYRSSNSKH
jgi:hypothetical protein